MFPFKVLLTVAGLLLSGFTVAAQMVPGSAVDRGNLQRTGVYAPEAIALPRGKLWQSDKLFVMKRSGTSRPNSGNLLIDVLGGGVWGNGRRVPNGYNYSTPVVHGGIIYFSLFLGDGYLYAVDVKTGKVKWKSTRPREHFTPPTIVGEILYTGSSHALHAIGLTTQQELWNYPIDDDAFPESVAPLVVDEVVYAGTSKGRIYALDVITGAVKWSFESNEPGEWRPPVYGEGTIFCARREGAIEALDAKSGRLRWRSTSSKGVRSLLLVGKDLFYVDRNRVIRAVDAATGTERTTFSKKHQTLDQLAAVDGALFYSGQDSGGMFATDQETGARLWRLETFSYCQEPAIAGKELYLTCGDQKVYAVDAATGKKLWSKDTGQQTMSAPVIADGALYFIADDGKVHAIK